MITRLPFSQRQTTRACVHLAGITLTLTPWLHIRPCFRFSEDAHAHQK